MIGGIFLIVLFYFITLPLLSGMKSRYPWFSLQLMKKLYWYHIFFALVYYVYASFNPSDSVAYYSRSSSAYESWFDAFQTGTPFIDFVGYPFVHYFFFSYQMMMVLFAWMGYWGFVYFYIFFKENTRFKNLIKGVDLITLLIFLPNMHFWTVSFGKGSIIFMGMGMAIFGLSKISRRKIILLLGLALVYYIRPHVFFLMAIGILFGLVTGRQNVPRYQKFLVFGGTAVALFLMYNQIMTFAHLDSENVMESFDQFSSSRSVELAKAGSGVDISNYPLLLKLFTFWFRPLFIDSPGVLGLIISFENLFYLFLFGKLFQKGFFVFLRKSSAIVKTSIVIFLATSLALSGTMSNLGIIMRQKSMVMYFLFFLILSFIDHKKGQQLLKRKKPVEKQLAKLQTT